MSINKSSGKNSDSLLGSNCFTHTLALAEILQNAEKVDKKKHSETSGIYVAIDYETEEVLYVGLSQMIGERVSTHISQLKNSSKKKRHWGERYKKNSDSVIWKIIEVIEDHRELNLRENYWANILQPKFNAATISTKGFKPGRKNKQLSKEDLILKLESCTPLEIARQMGITKTVVYHWMRKYQIEYISPRYTNSELVRIRREVDLAEVDRMIEKRIPMTEIAETVGCKRSALMTILKENGILFGGERLMEKISKVKLEDEYPDLTINQIADKHNLPKKLVRNELEKRGIPMRSNIEIGRAAGRRRISNEVQRDEKGRFVK